MKIQLSNEFCNDNVKIPCLLIKNNSLSADKYGKLKALKFDEQRVVNNLNNRDVLIDDVITTSCPLKNLYKYSFKYLDLDSSILLSLINAASVHLTDVYSHIIYDFLIRQSKLTKSILYLLKHNVYGKAYLLRSLCENCVDIGWLLYSKRNQFDNYIGNSLLNVKRYYEAIHSNDVNLEKQLKDNAFVQYKEVGWPRLKWLCYLRTSNKQIKKTYRVPTLNSKINDAIPDSKPLKQHYWHLCDIVHTSFVSFTHNNDKCCYNIRMLNLMASLLYKSVYFVYNKHIFKTNNKSELKVVIDEMLLLQKNMVVVIYLLICTGKFKI